MATHRQGIGIRVDDLQLSGTLIRPRVLVPGVLFVHGWGGCQEQYCERAQQVAALGCVCLTFDLRGHADTHSQRATVSRDENLRDVIAAFDLLAQQPGVDASAMALVGSSYGGYLASILTSLRKVRWLALRVPALYKDSDWELPKGMLHQHQALEEYRRRHVLPEESRALRACTQFEGDVLIVESEHDHVIPSQVITNYRDACIRARSLTYRVMKGADHGLSDENCQKAYTRLLVNWFGEMLRAVRTGELEEDDEPASADTAIA